MMVARIRAFGELTFERLNLIHQVFDDTLIHGGNFINSLLVFFFESRQRQAKNDEH